MDLHQRQSDKTLERTDIMSKKGRKVYRTNSYEKKKRLKKALRILFGMIIIAALVFVGYSVGKPIMNYLSKEDEGFENQEEPWTPPVVTSDSSETAASDESLDVSEKPSQDNTPSDDKNNSTGLTAFMLSESALNDPSQFSAMLDQVKSDGYTAVSITLKAKGGKIYYNTASKMANLDDNAVIGNMPIQQIAYLVKNSGLKMIAELNILEDNNRYGEYRDGSYHALDGSTWLDTAADKGGKPWLSPFEEETKEMVRFLADEVSAAGFDQIVLSGLVFPSFRNSDLMLLGETVKDPNRYKALIELANIAKTAANEHNTDLSIRVSASDIIYGKSEIFKPSELSGYTLLIDFDPTEFTESVVYNNNEIVFSEFDPSSKFKKSFEIIMRQCGNDVSVIPVISESGSNHADYDSLISEIISEGFESYFVK